MSHKVKVDLPEANLVQKPEDAADRKGPITLAVKEDGSIFWNDEEIDKQTLESRLATAAQQTPQPVGGADQHFDTGTDRLKIRQTWQQPLHRKAAGAADGNGIGAVIAH